MPPQRTRVKPTAYPFLPFHLIRSAQLLSSLVVASITFYFLRELSRDGYKLPWTFILLLTTSLLTILTLTATIILHIRHGLNPTLNIALNSLLALVWSVSFALLSWWCSGTLSHVCSTSHWDTDTGVAICRQYKALFSFALVGCVATLAALGLDVRVLRGARQRGVFQQVDGVGGEAGKEGAAGGGVFELEGSMGSVAMREGRGSGGASGGYQVPEEQFGYDDLGYHGAGGQIGVHEHGR